MAIAAGAGQLALMKHLHNMGCAVDELVFIEARLHCREKCLKYLLTQYGLPSSAAFRDTPTNIHCQLTILECQRWYEAELQKKRAARKKNSYCK